ncbi:chemotaxis protein CheA [Xylanimonas oleitrophica]|uniref:histidine kinase n=1 Tax=Xylanimonas oleitrophica TaxID=2607479 RepID=A0A2W5X1J1_9MICO|nr:chemotaxis protein CheA [Xylanimonas oleitrophica]PZR54145.1 chemotaxis protein CheA [Xylanimonas oleitrophica]
MDDVDEIVREFLVESHENLDQLDRDLVALESDPGSRGLLSSIFRTIHTIKGTSGFLAFSKLERLTHVGENLLVELREGRRVMDQPTTDVLLHLVDTVRSLLSAIEADGTEGDVEIDAAVAAILAVQEGTPGASAAGEPAAGEPAQDVAAPATQGDGEQGGGEQGGGEQPAPAQPAGEASAATEPPAAPQVETPAPAPAPAPQPAHDAAAEAHPEETNLLRSAADSSIRVDVEVLDELMRQVGELVLTRNRITRIAGARDTDTELVRSSQQLDLIAAELQEGVMRTRMQPIEHVWSKMPRVVRDLASVVGREVSLQMTGGDTELDRGLLEAVKDPLTHLVRNAVDHGIEPPQERAASGKDRRGTLSLRAYHSGGQVVVEVADDGRGIDPQKVAAKAVERGLRTPDQVAAMSPAELLQLLFLPGFSTAEKVTNVSGRGVGMDVVRTRIEAIGGTVDVESTVGTGTVWRLRIPLTLAIMPSLTVVCDGDVYALPQVNVLELVALDVQRTGAGIEHVHDAPVYRLRGELLPLVPLANALGLQERGAERERSAGVIVVVQADSQRVGLLVDRVVSTEEIVVTPLSPRLKAIGVYSGSTVLGDGSVALILDVQAISRSALARDGDLGPGTSFAGQETVVEESSTVEQVLVAGVGGRRLAMPLASVARLESLAADQVEQVGGREVVRYRGSILPLARLDRLLGTYTQETDTLLVIVYSQAGRSVGLVVDEILDIVDDDVTHRSDIEDVGLTGSTVIGDRVTELLDLRAAVLAADPAFELAVAASAEGDDHLFDGLRAESEPAGATR